MNTQIQAARQRVRSGKTLTVQSAGESAVKYAREIAKTVNVRPLTIVPIPSDQAALIVIAHNDVPHEKALSSAMKAAGFRRDLVAGNPNSQGNGYVLGWWKEDDNLTINIAFCPDTQSALVSVV